MKYAEKYGVSRASRKCSKSRPYICFWKQRRDESALQNRSFGCSGTPPSRVRAPQGEMRPDRHGFAFTNRFSGGKRDLPTLFEKTASEPGIRRKRIRPYVPLQQLTHETAPPARSRQVRCPI